MKDSILELIDEQVNADSLLNELEQAQNDQELLFTARKILAKRAEFNWLKGRINELFNRGAEKNGG